MILPTMFVFFVLIAISTISYTDFALATNADDDADYSGFYTSSAMPFASSDMSTNSIYADFGDGYNHRIYLIGGCIQNQQCAYYDASNPSGGFGCYCPTITNKCRYFIPAAQTWHSCANAPRNRYRHVSAVINNKIYVAGGRKVVTSIYELDEPISEIDVYDPMTDTWTSPLNWTTPYSDGAAFAYGNTLYLAGGYNQDYSETNGWLVSVDVTTNTWNYDLPSMNIGRGDVVSASYENSKVYVIGGWIVPQFCNASTVMESYDILENKWTVEKSMIYPRGDAAAGTLGNNIFAIGGETKDPSDATCSKSVPVPYVSRYNRLTDKWQVEANIPDNIFRFKYESEYNSSLSYLTYAIYLFGGQSTYEETAMIYPVLNTTLKYVPLASDFHDDDSSSEKISKGGIAGIVIGCFVFVVLVIAGIIAYMIYRRKGYVLANKMLELSQQGDKQAVMEADSYDVRI